MHSKAAALLHSLATTQPFVNGNKRTAAVAAAVFMRMNGEELVAEQGDLVELVMAVVADALHVDAIAGRLKEVSAARWAHDDVVVGDLEVEDPETNV